MILRIKDNYLNLSNIDYVSFYRVEEVNKAIVKTGGDSVDFSGEDADYLRSILDGQHYLLISDMKKNLPES